MSKIVISTPSQFSKDEKPFSSSSRETYPYFSFRYICQKNHSMKNCSIEQFKKISETLRLLSTLPWKTIESSPREQYGCEPLPQSSIRASMPPIVKSDEPIDVFRFGDGKRGGRLAGVRREDRFYILFVDSKYNLYDHG